MAQPCCWVPSVALTFSLSGVQIRQTRAEQCLALQLHFRGDWRSPHRATLGETGSRAPRREVRTHCQVYGSHSSCVVLQVHPGTLWGKHAPRRLRTRGPVRQAILRQGSGQLCYKCALVMRSVHSGYPGSQQGVAPRHLEGDHPCSPLACISPNYIIIAEHSSWWWCSGPTAASRVWTRQWWGCAAPCQR